MVAGLEGSLLRRRRAREHRSILHPVGRQTNQAGFQPWLRLRTSPWRARRHVIGRCERQRCISITRPELPGDVAILQPGGSCRASITTLNADLLADKKLGSVEEIWYESSKDKRKIHGWIIKPPDFDATKKYPLILEIHGGPFANYGYRFDLEKQLMAASGYVVLYTNPRGSTSYGEDFANLIHHAYPGDDFYDLNSGVDAMLAKGYIDPDAALRHRRQRRRGIDVLDDRPNTALSCRRHDLPGNQLV